MHHAPRARWSRAARAVLLPVAAIVAVATMAAGLPAGAAPAAAGSADLSVHFEQSAATTAVEGTVRFTVTVTNAGPDPAVRTAMVHSPNAYGGVNEVPVTTAGICSNETYGVVSCALGTLQAGASVRITYAVRAFSPGVQVNAIGVSSDTPDPVATDNVATADLIVLTPEPYSQRIVDGYFRALLGRAPTEAEQRTWSARFQAMDFPRFVRLLTATTTYRLRWLDRQFRAVLGRPAGPGGGTYLGWLRDGRSYDDVLASLVASDEFVARLPVGCEPTRAARVCITTVRDAWVRAAYRTVTGDQIPERLAVAYQAWLDAGASRSAVARVVVTVGEARRRFVDGTVRTFLHRPATRFETFLYVSALLGGERPEVTEASILAEFDAIKVLVAAPGA